MVEAQLRNHAGIHIGRMDELDAVFKRLKQNTWQTTAISVPQVSEHVLLAASTPDNDVLAFVGHLTDCTTRFRGVNFRTAVRYWCPVVVMCQASGFLRENLIVPSSEWATGDIFEVTASAFAAVRDEANMLLQWPAPAR